MLQAALPGAPLPEDVEVRRSVRQLPLREAALQQFVAANPDEANSAVEVYFQVGPCNGCNGLNGFNACNGCDAYFQVDFSNAWI